MEKKGWKQTNENKGGGVIENPQSNKSGQSSSRKRTTEQVGLGSPDGEPGQKQG